MVDTADGDLAIPYDRLLIATGSNPIMLPIPGINLPGVVAYRSIDDVEKMLAAAQDKTTPCKRAVVIGGGLLGLEAANGLSLQGMEVSVVHLCDWPMERQLDQVGGGLLKNELEKRGLKFYLSRQTEAILGENIGGEDKVTGLRFKDGEEIPADLVIMAAGIRPNIALAKSARSPLRARHRGERHDADLRPEDLCGGRMRAASRAMLRAGRAAVRAGQGGGEPSGRIRAHALRGLGGFHQAQGDRHRPVLGGRLQS